MEDEGWGETYWRLIVWMRVPSHHAHVDPRNNTMAVTQIWGPTAHPEMNYRHPLIVLIWKFLIMNEVFITILLQDLNIPPRTIAIRFQFCFKNSVWAIKSKSVNMAINFEFVTNQRKSARKERRRQKWLDSSLKKITPAYTGLCTSTRVNDWNSSLKNNSRLHNVWG